MPGSAGARAAEEGKRKETTLGRGNGNGNPYGRMWMRWEAWYRWRDVRSRGMKEDERRRRKRIDESEGQELGLEGPR